MPKTTKEFWVVAGAVIIMLIYFISARPMINDDGFQYEGFAESLAHGHLDFKSFYGFQGLAVLAAPVFWLTGSHSSIVIASAILSLLSVILAYLVGRDYYESRRAGLYFLMLVLLMPYPYTTMMRGFQEAALLFFVLLIIWASVNKKAWTPVAWAVGGIVKPFALVLAPLFLSFPSFQSIQSRFHLNPSRLNLDKALDKAWTAKIIWVLVALAIGGIYLGANYYQTGHFVNDAAINSYQPGSYNINSLPPLSKSFTFGVKGFLRVAANLLVFSRKILISPLVILSGAWILFSDKKLKLRKEIILAVFLNILLVGSLTFSFPKYLLPAVVLLALAALPLLMKHSWLMLAVFADSFLVFGPIYNYFGRNFWPSFGIFLIPFYLAILIFTIDLYFKQNQNAVRV